MVLCQGVSTKVTARDLVRMIRKDDVFSGAAALGFYLTLAIFPAAILTMSIVPYLPIERVDQAIMDLLDQALPSEAAQLITQVVDESLSKRSSGLFSFSLFTTIWAVSTGMAAVMRQLNRAYDVDEGRSFVRTRVTAFTLSLVFVILVIGAFSLIVLGGVVENWLGSRFGFTSKLMVFFAGFRWVVIAAALIVGFVMVHRYAPHTRHSLAFVAPGSLFGAGMIIVASLGFSLYVRNFANYDTLYGSIGAVIILMFWLYIAGLLILIGAEINVLIGRHGRQGSKSGEVHGANPRASRNRP